MSIRNQATEPTDVAALFLAERRSPNTRHAYQRDLEYFLGRPLEAARVADFLEQEPPGIAARLADYKANMISRALSEATVNRRLATIRSFLKFARRLGLSTTDGAGMVSSEPSQAYRDTRGIPVARLRELLAAPRGNCTKPVRDRAILRLLGENALRRAEVSALDVADFDAEARTLKLLGKGKGTQKVSVALSRACAAAISQYLHTAGHQGGPLFRNLDRNPETRGRRMTTQAIYGLVRDYGQQIGVKLSPHKVRHSSITAALDLYQGDVRKVQRFARHSTPSTTILYDDARRAHQAEVTEALSGLLE